MTDEREDDGSPDWAQSQEEARERLGQAEMLYARALDECMASCEGNPVAACELLLRRAFSDRALASAIIYSHVSLTLAALARQVVPAGPSRAH